MNLDNQTLIYGGVGLVVAAGIAFWSYRRTSNLEALIVEQNKRIAELEEVLKRVNQGLVSHDNALRGILGQPKREPPKKEPDSINIGEDSPEEEESPQKPVKKQKKKGREKKKEDAQ